MTDMLSWALGYAEHGWPVFVLSSSKVPLKNCPQCDPASDTHTEHERETCACLTCHGFYAATTDTARITEMIRLHPRGCLAVRTGTPSGLVVVDVDVTTEDGPTDPGLKSLAQLDEQGLLPGTVTGMTGSGGLHLLYAHPGGYVMSGAHKVAHKIDSKADGGYIVVPPSIHPRTGSPYRWSGDGRYNHDLPELHEALCARLRPPAPVSVPGNAWDQFRPARTPRGRLGGILRTVLEANGDRNDRLYWAAKKTGEMIAAGEIDELSAVAALQETGREVGLSENEIGDARRGTIGSGLRNGRRVAA
jgi:hypothetical protein